MSSKKGSSPASSAKKKQGKLFSFFAKKKPSPSPASMKPPPPKINADDIPASAKSAPGSKHVNKQPPPAGGKLGAKHLARLAKITVGTRVRIYWPDDKEYYAGRLTGRGAGSDSTMYTVLYDDETVETCDMAKEKFEIIGGKVRRSRDAGGDSGDEEVGNSRAKNGKKKRRIQEESEEEEFDEAMELDENDDDSEGGGDDSDGSAFRAGDETEDEDDDDDDDALMVTDEDDDEVLSSYKAKNKKANSKKRKTSSSSSRPRRGGTKVGGVKVTTLTASAGNLPNACSDDSNHAQEANEDSRTPTRPKSGGASGKSPLGTFSAFARKDEPEEKARKAAGGSARKAASAAVATTSRSSKPTSARKPLSAGVTPSPVPPCGIGAVAAAAPSKASGGGGGQKPRGEFRKPPLPLDGQPNPRGTHWHNHYKFVHYAKDSKGRGPEDPCYDPRTLKVDYGEIKRVAGRKNVPPAQEQWWNLKSQYADAVMLFKQGKFYEIMHMDADVATSALGINYMKGTDAHCGFPEAAFGTFSRRLIEAGYKVARVEQTETKEAYEERKRRTPRGAKKPACQNREVCSISTVGTRTFCFLDDARCFENGQGGGGAAAEGPLVAIREKVLEDQTAAGGDGVRPVCEYGVVIADVVRGVVTLGQFADDVLRSRMDTLLTNFAPSEILVEGGPSGASPTLLSLLKSAAAKSAHGFNVRIERVNPTENFPRSTAVDPQARAGLERPKSSVKPWDVDECLEELHRKAYYPRSTRGTAKRSDAREGVGRWPEVLRACVEGGADLALSAFGAVLYTLQRNLIDGEVLGMGVVRAYVPPGSPSAREGGDKGATPCKSGGGEKNPAENLSQLSARASRQESGIEDSSGPDSSEDSPHAPRELFSSMDTDNATSIAAEENIDHMVLDGTTIANLEILANSHSNTAAGSLWSKLDRTKSPHGSRLLRAWLLRPLFRKADIDRRADAVQELSGGGAAVAMSEARMLLAQCGDIERLLARVHSMGQGAAEGKDGEAAAQHPGDRAVLYETVKHTKRKVGDFSRLLKGLRAASRIPELFGGIDIHRDGLLCKIVRTNEEGGGFPADLGERLDWFFEQVDLGKAEKGEFEPVRGMDDNYDEACDAIERIEHELKEYREELLDELGLPGHVRAKCKYVNMKHEAKDKYLIEIPVSVSVPRDFQIKGQRKRPEHINKYRTPESGRLVAQLEEAIDAKKEGKARGLQAVFYRFDTMRPLWMAAQLATAMLDALGALAETASKPGYTRPVIAECGPNESPTVNVVQGQHPCVEITHSGGEYIPNDLSLGGNNDGGEDSGDSSRILLLSGPNMGGKSTLLRQTCLISILAQIGCYVPAEHCTITPVDRIFTRLGASDRILLGQSTFFVELAETAAALRGATRRSLVIMDELGRGTSTFDGTAIAYGTIKHLVERNRCVALFATHYHSLLEDWKDDPAVRLAHMESIVDEGDGDEEDEDGGDPNKSSGGGNITFLYTLGEGGCPKSFGINVARLAALPEEILTKARKASVNFEREMSGAGTGVGAGAGGAGALKKVTRSNAGTLSDTLLGAFDGGDAGAVKALWERLQ